ncbi:MAG: hypothetical protein U9Q88_21255 [Bacillota bacterium]|nr:hypothetical protein [Bacillota bacterium]
MVDGVLTLKFLVSLIVFGVLLIGVVKLLLRKSRFGPLFVALVLFVGGYFLYDQIRSTTSNTAVLAEYREDSEIRHLKISKVTFDSGLYTYKESILLEDEKTIRDILEDLSGLTLKREVNKKRGGAEYVLELLVSNPNDNIIETGTIHITVGTKYINDYRIVSEKEHLKTIKELEVREDLEWEKE